nr:MAG TPA: hypothetical protein [Caudoviricetes sp.]
MLKRQPNCFSNTLCTLGIREERPKWDPVSIVLMCRTGSRENREHNVFGLLS